MNFMKPQEQMPAPVFFRETVFDSEDALSTPSVRRTAILDLAARCCHAWFDANGRWRSEEPAPDTRETAWLTFGLLAGNERDVALANAVLALLGFIHHHPTRTEEEEGSPFCIFVTNHMVQLLALHGGRLTAPVRDKVEGWARVALRDYAGDRQSDYQFHGANDNMPAKATLGMILGGEYFGDREAVQHGLWNLRQLRDLLTRRGLLSEYTSPTYSALSIINLTEIALHAQNAEARELAAQCVERVWADLLGHFHPPTGLLGGPYSRSYLPDSAGHLNSSGALLWMALGNRVFPDPIEEMTRETLRIYHHISRPSQMGLLAWLASCPAEPPAHLVQWLNRRSYPFHLCATAERGGNEEPLVAGEVLSTHYQEEDFALGTAEGDAWTQLQTEAVFLQYRLRKPAKGIEDRRTMFARYLVNDRAIPETFPPPAKFEGLVHTVQKDRVVLVLARPALRLAGEKIHSLKFSVVLPTHFAPVEKLEMRDGHVFIQDGPLHLALRPLNVTDWGRIEAMRIETEPEFQTISFFNYEGEARMFTAEELGRTLNGFVVVIGLKAEEHWDAFRDRVKTAEVLDYFHFGSRVVRCRVGQTVLGMSYAVKTDRVRYASINGKLVERPAWDADGLPAGRLPFLEKPEPNTLELPYTHLRAVWAPGAPWTIGSTGTRVDS
jgi:hypothetical protein